MESVFKYRKNIEDQKKEDLARAVSKAQEEEEKLDSMYQKKRKSLSDDRMDINLMRQQQAYLGALDNAIKNQKEAVKKAREVEKQKRAYLNEAAVDRKIMEDFKGKCVEKYKEKVLQEEQKFFDELGVIGFNRKAN